MWRHLSLILLLSLSLSKATALSPRSQIKEIALTLELAHKSQAIRHIEQSSTDPYRLENEHQARIWFDLSTQQLHYNISDEYHFIRTIEDYHHFKNMQYYEQIDQNFLRIHFNRPADISSFLTATLGISTHTESASIANSTTVQEYEDDHISLDIPLKKLTQAGGWILGKDSHDLSLPQQYRFIARKPGGGMKGGIFKDSQERTWMIKEAGSPSRQIFLYDTVIREVALANLFREMGFPVINTQIIRGINGKLYVASPYIEQSLDTEQIQEEYDTATSQVKVNRTLYGKMFLAATLLGTWDFFTLGNVRFHKNQDDIYQPFLVDVGEALSHSINMSHFFKQDKSYSSANISTFLTQKPEKKEKEFQGFRVEWVDYIQKQAGYLFPDDFKRNIPLWTKSFFENFHKAQQEPWKYLPSIQETSIQNFDATNFTHLCNVTPQEASKATLSLDKNTGTLKITFDENSLLYLKTFLEQLHNLRGSIEDMLFPDIIQEGPNFSINFEAFEKRSRTGWKIDQEGILHIFFSSQAERNLFRNIFGTPPSEDKTTQLYHKHALKNIATLSINLKSSKGPFTAQVNQDNHFTLSWKLPSIKPINNLDDLREHDHLIYKHVVNQISQYAQALEHSFPSLWPNSSKTTPQSLHQIKTTTHILVEHVPLIFESYTITEDSWSHIQTFLSTHLSLDPDDYILKINGVPVVNHEQFQLAFDRFRQDKWTINILLRKQEFLPAKIQTSA